MSLACPRPCGRLATAAVFISVGVVQLIAGVILLKSKYVYLLSAPDFWTAFSNIAVGGLLGVSAGVWKNTSKRSSKHAVRRNILAALVTTSILMNSTTAVILIMGEGNALLSIHLENNGTYTSTTLAREILAYAYAASVCSPILSVVAAIIFLTGMCCTKERKGFDIRNVSDSSSKTFNWVYKTEQRGLPKPDPEIVRTALSKKSFTSSDDSSSSSDLPIRRDSIHDLNSSLKTKINRIVNPHGSKYPQTIHSCMKCTGNNAPNISHSGNRVSFVDDPPSSERNILEHNATGLQNGSEICNQCNPPKIKQDLYASVYDETRNACENKELEKLEGNRGIFHSQDASANASVTIEPTNSIPSKVFGRYSPPVAESFGENLRRFDHEYLRRTSTATNLIRIPIQEDSQDFIIDSPTEPLGHTLVRETTSGEGSDTLVQNSKRALLDYPSIGSREDGLPGEVVPIRVNTVPRKKLPAKLIPVSIPVVSNAKCGSLNKKECKFDDARKEKFSSFHGGHHMKYHAKSTGSNSAKHSERVFPAATPKEAVSEAPLERGNLQLSPAQTSGYISAMEDTTQPSSQDHFKSKTPDSSSSARSGSSTRVSARKKFRTARRKILDGGRPQSETVGINDIVKHVISENTQLSNEELIAEFLYNLVFSKVAQQSDL